MLNAFELALSVIKDKKKRIRRLEKAIEQIDGIAVSHSVSPAEEFEDMLVEITKITSAATTGGELPQPVRNRRLAALRDKALKKS